MLSAFSGEEALERLASSPVDLLVIALELSGMTGFSVLKKVRERYPELKIIIQTKEGGVEEAVEAIKHGASDFLEKGNSHEILGKRVGQMYDAWLQEQKKNTPKNADRNWFSLELMIGESSGMIKLKDQIVRVAPTDTTVLIQGESGTGKELIARAVHHYSSRSDQPFVAVDCASISENVVESELFGHAKGAFTWADANALGLIRSADKGTLFLDEIGELSLGVQAKFLRTIQERIVRPVGSTKNYAVDIRIVAATNRNLQDEISEGRFRQDLYYRLSQVTLVSPPLRERAGDIALLVRHILSQPVEGVDRNITLSAGALGMITRYDWPGNVRELENVLRGAMVFARDTCIHRADLMPSLGFDQDVAGKTIADGTLASYELEAIRNALTQAGQNRRKAAEILDISEATLYRKIKIYNL
jgi:DNA-binding NtrC family response regulator